MYIKKSSTIRKSLLYDYFDLMKVINNDLNDDADDNRQRYKERTSAFICSLSLF